MPLEARYEPSPSLAGDLRAPAGRSGNPGAARAFGHHWGTFRLTSEGIEQPLHDLAAALEAHGVPAERFRPLRPGEVWQA